MWNVFFVLALAPLLQNQPLPHSPEVPSNQAITAVQMPQGAAEILKLASEMNGLDVPSAKPWHIKISYDQFDDDGDNVHSGTVEEFYVGAKKWKRIFESDTLKQTDVATDTGLYRSGDQRWMNPTEEKVIKLVLRPIDAGQWERAPHRAEKNDQKLRDVRLNCVHVQRTNPGQISLGDPDFCFDPGTVMLRYVQKNLSEQITFNEIVPFQGHYLAKQIAVTASGKPYLKIHVEELGEVIKVNESFFAPPQDSPVPLGGRIVLMSYTYMDEYLMSRPEPNFPRGVNGIVHIRFVVGKDGHVIEATALDGPKDVSKPVLEAIRKYRFRPFLILDQAVEVESRTQFELHSR